MGHLEARTAARGGFGRLCRRLCEGSGCRERNAAVTADLTKHQTTGIVLVGGYPQIAYPTSGSWNNGVQVTLAVQKRLGFSSLFISAAPTITATATAAMVDDGDFCVVALEDTTTAGITIGGSADVNLGCGVISNSISVDELIDTNGNAYHLGASPVAGSGGLPTASLLAHGATNVQPYHMAQIDPYAGMFDHGHSAERDVPREYQCQRRNRRQAET